MYQPQREQGQQQKQQQQQPVCYQQREEGEQQQQQHQPMQQLQQQQGEGAEQHQGGEQQHEGEEQQHEGEEQQQGGRTRQQQQQPTQPQQQQRYVPEWDSLVQQQDDTDNVLGFDLFDDAPMEREDAVQLEGVEYRIRSFGQSQFFSFYRASRPETGLQIWDASSYTARMLLACKHLFAGCNVLELGAGAAGVVALAAARVGRSVLSTDGSALVLDHLRANIAANAHKVVCERVRVAQLAWGDAADVAAVRALQPGGFDLIVGSDLLYQRPALPLLMSTCAALLRCPGGGRGPRIAAPAHAGGDAPAVPGAARLPGCAAGGRAPGGPGARCWGPRVLLCFKPRNNIRACEYIDAARAAGLEEDAALPPQVLSAASEVGLERAGVQLLVLRWQPHCSIA